jgi:hypothetical protein
MSIVAVIDLTAPRPRNGGWDYRSSMDISHFDFELDEVVDLIPRLTGLADTIVLEPRSHQADEDEELHPIRTAPTFRVSSKLKLGDQAIQRMANFTTETGVEVVLDRADNVRFRKAREKTAP